MRELQIDGQTLTLIPDNVAEALRRACVEPGYFVQVAMNPFPAVRLIDSEMTTDPYRPIRVALTDRVRISIEIEVSMSQQTYFQIGDAIYRGR